jgi:hypothetical protein
MESLTPYHPRGTLGAEVGKYAIAADGMNPHEGGEALMENAPTAPGSNGQRSSDWPSIVQAAVAYGARGWSVIPLQNRQPKFANWIPYQTQRPDERRIRWLFGYPWDGAGVGIVCGPISHGLAVLEITDSRLAERLIESGAGRSTCVVRTPNQGMHLYVYGTQKLTQTGPLIPNVANLIGSGAYVVAPPSLGYTVITHGPIVEVPDVKAWAVALLAKYGVAADETQQAGATTNTTTSQPDHQDAETQQQQSVPTVSPKTNLPARSLTEQKDGDFYPISLGQIEEPGPRIEIVERLIPEGYSTVLFGDGGTGKSYLALGLAMCVAAGQPFVRLAVRSSGVLYLDWELNPEEFQRRGFSIARGLGLSRPPTNMYYAQVARPFSSLVRQVKSFVDQQQVGLVILDSVGLACAMDPELAREMIGFFALLRSLGVTILTVDHQSKLQEGQHYAAKSPFGSAYKSHLARSVIQVERVGGDDGWLSLRLHQKKRTFGPLSHELGITLRFDQVGGMDIVRVSAWDPQRAPEASQHVTDQQKLGHSLRKDGPATSDVLAQRTGVHPKTVRNHMARLRKAGKVQEVAKKGHAVIWGWMEQTGSEPNSAAPTSRDGSMIPDFPVEGQTNATHAPQP